MLSDREKMVLHFCCTITIAKVTGIPHRDVIVEKIIEDIRKNRCRSIAPEDLDDILEEVSTEMLTSKTMFKELMDDTLWSMTGKRPNQRDWSDMK